MTGQPPPQPFWETQESTFSPAVGTPEESHSENASLLPSNDSAEERDGGAFEYISAERRRAGVERDVQRVWDEFDIESGEDTAFHRTKPAFRSRSNVGHVHS